jgi:hypothetical protein
MRPAAAGCGISGAKEKLHKHKTAPAPGRRNARDFY